MHFAVCGLHMRGGKFNDQLLSRHATFIRETTTLPKYTMYALHDINAPIVKPALVFHPDPQDVVDCAVITVEIWDIPQDQIGSLLQLVPAPLAFGTVHLADSSTVYGFVAEAWASDERAAKLMGIRTENITRFGGWRQWQQHCHNIST